MDVETHQATTTTNGNASAEAPHNGDAHEESNEKVVAKGAQQVHAGPRNKRKRSRSKTPQTLHVNISKLTEEVKLKGILEQKEDNSGDDKEVKEDKVNEKNNGGVKENGDHEPHKEVETSPKRSQTPKRNTPKTPKKDKPKSKIDEVESTMNDLSKNEKKEQQTPRRSARAKSDLESGDHETTDMDPLLIADEPESELQFDETSDIESSGKASPVIRCTTRRSLTRNIPTPKTPKMPEPVEEEDKSITPTNQPHDQLQNGIDEIECNYDSTDLNNVSTCAVVDSDQTRLEFDDSAYLNASRERSLTETLRGLGARRPIRATDDYRQLAMRGAASGSDGWSAGGVKRKGRSHTPEDEERKKFKAEANSDGARTIGGLLISPLATLKSRFRVGDYSSSTPKLLGYRDDRNNLPAYGEEPSAEVNGDDEKKGWCSVM